MKHLLLLAAALPAVVGCFREPVAAPPSLTRDDVVAIIREEQAGAESVLADRLAALDVTLKGINVTLVGFNDRLTATERRVDGLATPVVIAEPAATSQPPDIVVLTDREKEAIAVLKEKLLERGINDLTKEEKALALLYEAKPVLSADLRKAVTEHPLPEILIAPAEVFALTPGEILSLWDCEPMLRAQVSHLAKRIKSGIAPKSFEIEKFRDMPMLRRWFEAKYGTVVER